MRLVESGGLRCFWSASVLRQIDFLESPATVFLLKNQSRSSKFVSIEIDQNTKVKVLTSTIGQFITKFFKLVATNKLYARILRNRLLVAMIRKRSNFH